MTDQQWELLKYAGILAAAVAMVFVVNWRRRSHREFLQQYAEREICPHLRPAFDLLQQRGHRVIRAGQYNPDMPLEIHIAPPFDPAALADELKLADPVFVSERNVLYCQEDWCELHPRNA